MSETDEGNVGGRADEAGAADEGQGKGQEVLPRPKHLAGETYRVETPLGKAYVTVNRSGEGEPFEVFVNLGKAGSDLSADAEAIGRLISLVLRLPDPIPAKERLQMVAAELQGIGGSRSIGYGEDRVRSLPDGVATAIRRDLHAHGE